MADELLIALDQGSSSCRALAFGRRGVVARVQLPLRPNYPRAGWVEYDAERLARDQERCFDQLLQKLGKRAKIAGVAIATQRSTIIAWDAQSGKPLAPALSWQDGRAAGNVAPLQEKRDWFHIRTGLYPTPYYSAPKIQWLLENDARVSKAAAAGRLRVGPVGTFLAARLTAGKAFVVDPTLAQRTLLFNLEAGDWDAEILGFFGVSRQWLPCVVASSGSLATVRRGGRELPLLAMVGDQQAAAVALSGGGENACVVNYGTGAFFLRQTGEKPTRIPGLLTSVARQAQGKRASFFVEGTVNAAGGAIDWLSGNLGLFKTGSELQHLCAQSRQRLLALPALGGLGAPRWDYGAPTVFFGMTPQTRAADIVRAVLEGIAFLVADIVETARDGGVSVPALRAAGGLAHVDHLLQFQAELLQAKVERVAEPEATALGAALLAAEAAGGRAAKLPRARTSRSFAPKLRREDALALRLAWRSFVETQVRLARSLQAIA